MHPKYRAWDKKTKLMCEVVSITWSNGLLNGIILNLHHNPDTSDDGFEWRCITDVVLMQNTPYREIHHKEGNNAFGDFIHEFDIITICEDPEDESDEQRFYPWMVEYTDKTYSGNWQFHPMNGDDCFRKYYGGWYDERLTIKIIGNKFNNPELVL